MRSASKLKNLSVYLLLLALTSSCSNVLEGISSDEKNSEDAILYSARMHLATGDWNDALSDFARLSTGTLAETDVLIDHASAYSGLCGLDFLKFASAIDNIGSLHMMNLVLQNVTATTTSNLANCKLAENLLKTAANASGLMPTSKGQYLMAFSSLAKIGAILNYRADANKDNNVDAGWDPCSVATGDTDLPQSDVAEILTGIVLFYQNIKNVSYAASLVADIQTLCTTVAGTPADFCSTIDPTTVTQSMRQIIRGLVVETSDGIGLSIHPGDTIANACGS